MQNGFIYSLFNRSIKFFYYMNLVEFFKFVGRKLNPNKNDQASIDTYNRVFTDIFILLKWIFLMILWSASFFSRTTTIIVWYLIVTNLYTYFYYHIWEDTSLNPDNFTIARSKRRFLNLLLAIAFSTFSFGYLYQMPYWNHFNWKGYSTFGHSLMYSFSNSLAANYAEVGPITDHGNQVSLIQLLFTFVFLTIILSKSLPQTNSNT
jgi:hypothetical protein